jgi:flagellar protein FliS
MYGNQREGYELYQESDLAIQAAAASPYQLVMMLF